MEDEATTSSHPPHNAQLSVSNVLSVPIQFLVSHFRNKREAEVILEVSSSAKSIDRILRHYESAAAQTPALCEAWNMLWLSREPLLATAIPIIGQRMSEVNQQRAMLINKLDKELCKLQELRSIGFALSWSSSTCLSFLHTSDEVLASSLLHFMDINQTITKELKAEGIVRLAEEKTLLLDVEQELVARIRAICTGASLKEYCNMSHFIAKLIGGAAASSALPMEKQMVRQNARLSEDLSNGTTAEKKQDSVPGTKEHIITEAPKIFPSFAKNFDSIDNLGRKIEDSTTVQSENIGRHSALPTSAALLRTGIESTFLKTNLELDEKTFEETRVLNPSGLRNTTEPGETQQLGKSLKVFTKSLDLKNQDPGVVTVNSCSLEKWPVHEEHSSSTPGYHTNMELMGLDSSSSASEEQLPGRVAVGKTLVKIQQQDLIWRHGDRGSSHADIGHCLQVASDHKTTAQPSSLSRAGVEETNQPNDGQIVERRSASVSPGTSNNTNEGKVLNSSTVHSLADKVSETLKLTNLQHYWNRSFSEKTSLARATCNSPETKCPTNGDACVMCIDFDSPHIMGSPLRMKRTSLSLSKDLVDSIAEQDQNHCSPQNPCVSSLIPPAEYLLQSESSDKQDSSMESSRGPAKKIKISASDNVLMDDRHQSDDRVSNTPDVDESLDRVELCQNIPVRGEACKNIDSQVAHDCDADGFEKLGGECSCEKDQSSKRRLEPFGCQAGGHSYGSHYQSALSRCYSLQVIYRDPSLPKYHESRGKWLMCGASFLQHQICVAPGCRSLCSCMQGELHIKARIHAEAVTEMPQPHSTSSKYQIGSNGNDPFDFLMDGNTEMQYKLLGCPPTPNVSPQTSAISSDDPLLNMSLSVSEQ